MASPLEGIRVIDLTIWQQGPFSTAMLGDLGADVIKIEGPDNPDPGRDQSWERNAEGLNAYFHSYNRSKRGIVVDLKSPRGREVIYRMVKGADVFVSNLRAPALGRLGLDYATLKKINPRLIYARASGYGPKGPDRDAPAMDLAGQARSGLMSVTGEPDDPPLPAGIALADQTGAILLSLAVVTALLHRERTGEGQEVDSSLLGGQICLLGYHLTNSLFNNNTVPQRRQRAGAVATWNAYQGKDGKWFVIAMGPAAYWPRICAAVGRQDWLSDPRYAEQSARIENARDLIADFDAHFATRSAADWLRIFAEADLLAAPVQDFAEVARDPQIIENGYITPVERPDGEPPVWMVGPPIGFSETPVHIRGLAPDFDQHTDEVLLEFGYTPAELADLRSDGAIGAHASPSNRQ